MDAIVTAFRLEVDAWLEQRLNVGTQRRYSRARAEFTAWCAARGIIYSTLSPAELDVLAARFCLCNLEDEGDERGRQMYVDLVAALQRRAGAKLPLAKRVLVEWAKIDPPTEAVSMPAELAFAAAVVLGMVWHEYEAAIITVLSFAGLLRFGEGAGLLDVGVHLLEVADGAVRDSLVLELGSTKRGFEERVVLTNQGVIDWVRRYLACRRPQPHGRFAAISYSRFTRLLRAVLLFLGFGAVHWRTHSLRRGGASALFELGYGFDSIRLYGRWASESSARLYIRAGANAVLRLRRDIPPVTWTMVRRIAALGSLSMA